MKYSGFLLSSAAAAMITILGQVPVWATDTIRVSYETTDTHLKARTVAIFKKELESTSGGKLSVETYPGASLIPSKQEVSAAIRGQVGKLSYLSSATTNRLHPKLNYSRPRLCSVAMSIL